MKTAALVFPALLLLSQLAGRAMENQFIRKPGQYSLDSRGSMMVITTQATGLWTLKATWHSGDAAASVAPDDCLRAHGWFVFVENPGRLWIFDGIDHGILVSNSGKTTAVTAFSSQLMTGCPRKVWQALPPEVRAKYQKLESRPPASKPVTPSASAGSIKAGGP